jgi:pimeloyl-ACP methyl ester carboxylesterase
MMMRGLLAVFVLITACATPEGPVGRRIDIGGRRLHIVCMGEGPRTVVLESGAAVGFYEWWLVQSALRDEIRTCSYDRAGFGWSEPPPSRSVAGYVTDLHELLRRSGEKPPFILVGHSMGGSFVQRYYWQYPSEVAGIIAVDAANAEWSRPKLPELQQAGTAHRARRTKGDGDMARNRRVAEAGLPLGAPTQSTPAIGCGQRVAQLVGGAIRRGHTAGPCTGDDGGAATHRRSARRHSRAVAKTSRLVG